MKINYITYHNYRCFDDITICFETTETKNISLVLGVTGTGKTEMLFSFQWVLYGFDFSTLREKEETPYALSSTLYHKLESERNALSFDCWVEMSFTYKERQYFVKRTETFTRSGDKIKVTPKVEFSHKEFNGERTTPEKDMAIVEDRLSRIIPKSILEGITFDGERMKKLNIMNDQTKETIKNVVSLVTNESLLELCSEEINDIKRDVSKTRRRINKESGNDSADEIERQIEEAKDDIEDNRIKLAGVLKNQDKINNNLQEISDKLGQLQEAHDLEQRRKGLEKDREKANKNFDQCLDQFYKRLVDGYALVTDKLVRDVKKSIETVDVPSGLTVEAVQSILKRTHCICGHEMDENAIQTLKDMLSTLPPDNIGSTILYMANRFAGEKKRAKDLIKEAYTNLQNSEDELSRIKEDLSKISASLITSVSETVKELEIERDEKNQYLGKLNRDEKTYINEIERLNTFVKVKKRELELASGNQAQVLELNAKDRVLDLFTEAITKIRERNSELSLESINSYLSDAFSLLSDDKDRRLYLCQYTKSEKYKFLTYVQKTFLEKEEAWRKSGKINALKQEGKNDKEIFESIVVTVGEGKSTGQSKINSLAFAKAILDYSNEDRSDENLSVSHDYPFLIDSPFTEISGQNLTNVGNYIHTFAHQIILMADNQSYGLVKQYVEPYVNTTTQLNK